MEKRQDISTTKMVEDIFYRDWLKKEHNATSTSSGKSVQKRKYIGNGPVIEWIKLPNSTENKYFKFAKVGDIFLNQGDNIMIPAEDKGDPPQIGHVAYMFESPNSMEKMCHAHFYCRGTDTIMGDKSDPRELFLVDHCEDIPLRRVLGKAKVHRMVYKSNWQLCGGNERPNINDSDDGKNYYFSKRYDYEKSRFVDFDDNNSKCISCFWQQEEEKYNTPLYHEKFLAQSYIEWQDEKYFVGSGIFIDYEREETKSDDKENKKVEDYYTLEKLDDDMVLMSKLDREIIFPERYRKSEKRLDSTFVTCEPLTVGMIEKIIKHKSKISVKVREFYRHEDIKDKEYGDPFLVYWTNRIYTIQNMEKWKSIVKGKCYISNTEHIIDKYQWIKEGPFRFYFEELYDPNTDLVKVLPMNAKTIGLRSRKTMCGYSTEAPPIWPELNKRLKTLDIYAGCGGLSDGLERAGLVETNWAIENKSPAAKAFKLNNPSALVLEYDCNDVLSLLLKGQSKKIKMPEKGEVDMIVGGPPCQGYSVINRFRTADTAKENNSQINTYLGFIDYYRPNYFIFENVRNFVSFNNTLYLKLTLKCILAIGYQVSFGVLQAGNYGLPQTRRRFFIIGAAPGLKLPKLPEPTHCFGRFVKTTESITVDKLKYDIGETGIGVFGSLPYRTVTIRDAISDLPYIDYDTMNSEMSYDDQQQVSSYVRSLREYCNRSQVLTDHTCNNVSAIVKKRIKLIPKGGDWTDMPNISVKLEDGTTTDILEYIFRTKNQKINDPPRGVCPCAQGDTCAKNNRYSSKSTTLIPWSIAHTADRNGNWRGVYGRLDWDGYFGTVTTNPEPTRTQGKVLHPSQNRIISVREYARAQGFHDEFQFADSTIDRYRQIGNAVPPILATAIGREIVKSIYSS